MSVGVTIIDNGNAWRRRMYQRGAVFPLTGHLPNAAAPEAARGGRLPTIAAYTNRWYLREWMGVNADGGAGPGGDLIDRA